MPTSAVKRASPGRHIRSSWLCLKSSANGIRLCRLMCGSAPRFRRLAQRIWGCAPKPGRSPKFNIELAGRPEAFRTSDGTAGPLKEFLGKASHIRCSAGIAYAFENLTPAVADCFEDQVEVAHYQFLLSTLRDYFRKAIHL